MTVTFNGQVSVCDMDWSYETIIGNAKKESLFEICHGSKLHEFRRMHAEMRRDENPACNNCGELYVLSEKSDLDPVARNDVNKLLVKLDYQDRA